MRPAPDYLLALQMGGGTSVAGRAEADPKLALILLRLAKDIDWLVTALDGEADLCADSFVLNEHYRRRREHGDWHAAAQRHLLYRFLGQLHHCLPTRQHFDEQGAFAPLLEAAA